MPEKTKQKSISTVYNINLYIPMPTDIAVDANKQTWANIEMPILISESRSEWARWGEREREKTTRYVYFMCSKRILMHKKAQTAGCLCINKMRKYLYCNVCDSGDTFVDGDRVASRIFFSLLVRL